MANRKVVIKAVLAHPELAVEDLYIVGSLKNLGAWDASKAVKMTKTSEGAFEIIKQMPEGETVEYKLLAAPSWDAVEKGQFHEDFPNHSFVVEKGLEVLTEVHYFGN